LALGNIQNQNNSVPQSGTNYISK